MLLFLRRTLLLYAFKFFDILGMFTSLFMSYYVVSVHSNRQIAVIDIIDDRFDDSQFLLFIFFTSAVWHIIFNLSGLYKSKRLSSKLGDIPDIFKATSYGTLSMLGLAFIFKIENISVIFLITFWTSSNIISIIGRIFMRYTLITLRISGRNLRFMIIVGTNQRALEIVRKIEIKPELGYRIVGFVDQEWIADNNYLKNKYPIVANFNNFVGYLRQHIVDEVLICLPMKSFYDQAFKIISSCEEQGIIIRFLPDLFDLKFARSKVGHIENNPIITLKTGSIEDSQNVLKRLFDILLSFFLLLISLPLFIIIALLIKFESDGPTFFIQDRIGLNKRRFKFFKFRTMEKDAEKWIKDLEDKNEVSGPVFKIKNDPRITRIGKILRKTSLDELPQLINVLKGDMSLVGPRPLPVRDYEGFDLDWHRRRFSVRPGMTCFWQINGRNDIPFERWMELDMKYIDQWTFWLDIKILFKTIPAVLKGIGAS